jgi:alkylhydroperoxidase family enzyme
MTDLMNVRPLAISGWDPVLAPIAAEMRGRPLNVHKLMANNPELLKAWWDFRMHVVSGGRLSQRHRELIVLRVAVRMKCWYEWASHVERGLIAGLSLREIDRIRLGNISSEWDLADQLILSAADECFDLHRITAEMLAAMRARFTAAELMDLIAIFGAYAILGIMINTWGLELDAALSVSDEIDEKSWLHI